MKESRQIQQPLSPSKNKLNLNFTFTNDKAKKAGFDEEFFYDLHNKLEENSFDIKRIKENLGNFTEKNLLKSSHFEENHPFSSQKYEKIEKNLIKNSNFSLQKHERIAENSKNNDFLQYLESLKSYRAEAISKTLNYNKRKRSIIHIQKVFRGYLVRKAYKKLREKDILDRFKRLFLLKKREYIRKNAFEIIRKNLKNFVRRIKQRKTLIFKKFVNHCARLIQRFFKNRVIPLYQLKKALFFSKKKKKETPDFSLIKNESFFSSLKTNSVLKTEGAEKDQKICLKDSSQKENTNKWDEMPVGSKITPFNENSQKELNCDEIETKRKNSQKDFLEENEIKAKSSEKFEENPPNKWEMRENMPVGGSSKNNAFLDEELYVPSNKKPLKKREFLKKNAPKKNEEEISEVLPEENQKKSHFKNFSKNLTEINTNNLNNSMEDRELTNTLSALTYESPAKTNFKKKSQLFSPLMNNSESPMKKSPIKKAFLKKKNTPKTVKKEDLREKNGSFSSRRNDTEEDSKEKCEEKYNFLKKKPLKVISQKLNWKNVGSRTNCWLNKKSPRNSYVKNEDNEANERENTMNFDSSKQEKWEKNQEKWEKNKEKFNKNNQEKFKNLQKKSMKKGEVREKIVRKSPDPNYHEKMDKKMIKAQRENEYTSSNITIPEPFIQINSLPLQMKTQQISDGLNEQNQLMSSIELKNNTISDNRKEISNLSRIYKGSESSINSSVKYEKILAVEELERAYRTNYFGKLTSTLLCCFLLIFLNGFLFQKIFLLMLLFFLIFNSFSS